MLSSTLSNLYFNGTPDPAINNRAKVAADRARALDPDGSLTHYALSRYKYLVGNDVDGAETEATLALQRAPNDVSILRQAASLEQSLGRWNDALTHLQQARRLDPRSVTVGAALQQLLTYLRRYPEALAVGNEMLTLDPANLLIIEDQAQTHLMEGDLAGARAVLANAPPTLAQPALVAYFGNYQDMYWMLDDAQQQLLLRLTPSAFFDDRARLGRRDDADLVGARRQGPRGGLRRHGVHRTGKAAQVRRPTTRSAISSPDSRRPTWATRRRRSAWPNAVTRWRRSVATRETARTDNSS